jgi:hypothetical protein
MSKFFAVIGFMGILVVVYGMVFMAMADVVKAIFN